MIASAPATPPWNSPSARATAPRTSCAWDRLDLNEDVIRLAQGLLGVLGSVREIGDSSYGLDVAVAVGGG